MEGESIQRHRSRPSNAHRGKTLPAYSGPSLDEVLAYSDDQVTEAFDAFQIHPRQPIWNDENIEASWAAWSDGPLEEPVITPTAEQLASARKRAMDSHA